MLKMEGNIKKRELAITIAITLKLSYEETQELLKINDVPELYARDRRDSIIIWAIYHGRDVKEVNEICKNYNCDFVSGFDEILEMRKLKNVKRRTTMMKRKNEGIGSATGFGAGAYMGAKIGSHIGIAIGGPVGAVAGTIPCAVVGGIIGLLTGNKIGTEMDREEL